MLTRLRSGASFDQIIEMVNTGRRARSFRPRRVLVRVAVRHGSESIILPGTRSVTRVAIHARKNKLGMERTKLELIQLGVALAVILAALASGARDQLEKLDLLGAIVAIFVLGFGADVVKNLVARRTPQVSSTNAT